MTSRRRGWTLPLIVLAMVAAYALAGFVGVPRLITRIAHSQAEKLGRKLEIGEVRFNPFTFEARIAALLLTEADGAPLLGFEQFDVDLAIWRSIGERGLVLKSVRLTAPDLSVVVNRDGSINLAKLLPPSPDGEKKQSESALPRIVIGDLAIERGRIALEDRSRPQPFHIALSPIEFRLADFRTQKQHESEYTLKGTASSGEMLQWTGDFSMQPLGSNGKFSLTGLKAATIASYLQDQLPVRLASGVADITGDYRLSLDDGLALSVHLPIVTLRDLALAEPGREQPAITPISLGGLSVRETLVSVDRREVTIDRVQLKKLRADVLREADGGLNLARLIAPAPLREPMPAGSQPVEAPSVERSAPAAPAATPWRIAVRRIELDDAAIHAEDRSVDPAVRLEVGGATASITGMSTDAAATLHVEAALGVGESGHASVQGDLRLQPLSGQAAMDVQGIDLSILQPYLSPHTGLVLQSATFGVKGSASFARLADGGADVDFTGEAAIAKLDLQDRASRQDLLGWDQLKLGGIAFHSAPQSLSVARVDLTRPFASVEISKQRQLNIADALKAPGASLPIAAKPVAAAIDATTVVATSLSSPLPVRIDAVHLEQGRLRFSDRSIDPNFSAGIFALGGDILRISSDPKTQTKIHLEGKVDQFAPVIITGTVTPAAYASDTDITMSFRNMDLISFNPYSGRFAGYNIVQGKLTTDLHYKIRDRALDASHHVVLDQLEFGDATGSKDAVPLPVKLAVALLKDRQGRIDLSLPVSGSLDDPAFRIAPLLWKVVVDAMSRAVSAPFAALASLIGGDEDELAYVEFQPGSSELGDDPSQKLGKLASALVERPQLRLEVPIAVDDRQDAPALARQALAQRLPPVVAAADPAKTRKLRIDALEKLHQQMLGRSPAYPKMDDLPKGEAREQAKIAFLESALLPQFAADADALQELAASRAGSVIAALIANPQIQAERLFQTSRKAASVTPAGTVRMELSLQ